MYTFVKMYVDGANTAYCEIYYYYFSIGMSPTYDKILRIVACTECNYIRVHTKSLYLLKFLIFNFTLFVILMYP